MRQAAARSQHSRGGGPPITRAERAVSRSQPLHVALLTYRGNRHSGGQGVYVRHLSRELAALGALVEVLSGPPYPDLDDPAAGAAVAGAVPPRGAVRLTKVPGLDLYREPDPFRLPRLREFRSAVDVLEYALMCSAGFPEPLTFSLRVARLFADRMRRGDPLPDVIHDNQGLGYGLLDLQRRGFPVMATVHHPIAIDRRIDLKAAVTLRRRLTLRRWYGFLAMQRRVVARLPRVISVSSASATAVERSFDLPPGRVGAVPIGVDPAVFRPRPEIAQRPGRLIAVMSADVPLKGLVPLLEAIAKVRVERRAELVVVGRPSDEAVATVDRLGIASAVTFESAITTDRLVHLFAEAQVAVVPSLYEGFSLPAVEAMSSCLPVVATTGGALPEVIGPDGHAGLLVTPGDSDAMALAVSRLLDDPALRRAMGMAGRARVQERFTWRQAAERTMQEYHGLLRGAPAATAGSSC